jgi:ubiquinone/menaquinone biosynthesis C-methylase UbiE
LKELEDLTHFPSWLRNFQTQFIGFVVVRFKIYSAFVQHIRAREKSSIPMTDLCSGSGEPAIHIFTSSGCFSQLVLSDKYPYNYEQTAKINYLQNSIDAMEMAFQPNICYTMFNAFHHFEDKEQLAIVQKILQSGSKSYFVEILEPNLIVLLKVLFTTTIGNLLLTPFIRPFSFLRLFFTYIIPINVFTIAYDGVVSVFKSKTLKQYKNLLSPLGESIQVFKLGSKFAPLIVIEINPK